MENFLKSPEGLELSTLCLDYGYKLAEHPSELTRDQINFLMAALVYRLKQIKYASPLEEGTTRIIFE
ncbi:hypothetical protein KEJ34_02740 [Candidatus Bathyarchaeota archaeon]|nr:hypothetical protein [Candidatus Bathyarchaeota archaeon]